jgi:thiamine kinase-like enzyme
VQSLPTTWRQQNIGEAAINQLVEEFAPSQAHDLAATMRTFPTEPETALVLAHGDPVPKNTIMSATGPVLIDYELAQPLPAEYDIAHIAAHIAELLPAATALEITQHYLRERGLDHDRNAVAAACLWGRMRDRALWIREQPLRADDFDIIMALLAAA